MRLPLRTPPPSSSRLASLAAVLLAVSASACAAPIEDEPESTGNAMKAEEKDEAEETVACLGARATPSRERQAVRRSAGPQVLFVDVGPRSAAELAVPPAESVTAVPVWKATSTAKPFASAPSKGPITLGNAGTRTVRYRVTFAANERWGSAAGFVHVSCKTIRQSQATSDGADDVCMAGETCTTISGTRGTCQTYGVDASAPDADGAAIGLCR